MMGDEGYFCVISASPDGVYVDLLSKEILERRLNEDYYGTPIILDAKPENNDPNYWASDIQADGSKTLLLIIRGKIVKPIRVHWKLL